MVKSPLMFGGDMRKIDKTTLKLITNPTILEIDHFSQNNMEVFCPFYYIFPLKRMSALYIMKLR